MRFVGFRFPSFFQGITHAVENVIRFLVVAISDVLSVLLVVVCLINPTLVLVVVDVAVVVVVNLIHLADDRIQFLHAPVLTPTAALTSVSLFFLSSLVFVLHFVDL